MHVSDVDIAINKNVLNATLTKYYQRPKGKRIKTLFCLSGFQEFVMETSSNNYEFWILLIKHIF